MANTGAVFDAFGKDISKQTIPELPEEESINKTMIASELWHTDYVDLQNNNSALYKNIFKPLWEASTLKNQHKHVADKANYRSLEKITQSVLQGKSNIPEQELMSCEELLKKFKDKEYNQLQEELIKKHRLLEAKRLKRELKEKLETIETDINILKDKKFEKKERVKYVDYSQMDSKEHKKYVLQKQKEHKQFEQIKQERRKQLDQQLENERKRLEEQKKLNLEQELLKRREKIDSKLNKLKEQQEERHHFQNEGNERYKEARLKNPLFIKKQKQFEQIQLNGLEEKKKSLANIRQIQTPNIEELKIHDLKYKEEKKTKEEERQQNHKKHLKELRKYYKKPEYECSLFEINQQEKQRELEKQEELKKQREIYNKKKNDLAEIIRKEALEEFKNRPPKTDKDKENEISISHDVNSSKNFVSNKKQLTPQTHKKLYEVGLQNLEKNKKRAKKLTEEELEALKQQQNKTDHSSISPHGNKSAVVKKTTNSFNANSNSTPNFIHEKFKDYNNVQLQLKHLENLQKKYQNIQSQSLHIQNNNSQQFKSNNNLDQENSLPPTKKFKQQQQSDENNQTNGIHSKSPNSKILNSILNERKQKQEKLKQMHNEVQKTKTHQQQIQEQETIKYKERKQVQNASEKLTRVAKQKEKLLQLGAKDDVEDREQVANLYMTSIRAKLQLLNENNKLQQQQQNNTETIHENDDNKQTQNSQESYDF